MPELSFDIGEWPKELRAAVRFLVKENKWDGRIQKSAYTDQEIDEAPGANPCD